MQFQVESPLELHYWSFRLLATLCLHCFKKIFSSVSGLSLIICALLSNSVNTTYEYFALHRANAAWTKSITLFLWKNYYFVTRNYYVNAIAAIKLKIEKLLSLNRFHSWVHTWKSLSSSLMLLMTLVCFDSACRRSCFIASSSEPFI